MHGLARIGILHAMTPAAAQQALVIATFSQRMRLRLDDDSEVVGRLKGKKMRPVCGDEVMAEPIENEPEWLITDILPRRNELSRPDRRGRAEVLAANIDLVTVVSTDAPATDWFIVDRYLAAAELIDVPALVVFNKTDLGAGKSSLINFLVKDADQQTARLSQSTGEGRHTTVNSVMWSLPGGGALIDSPGVRDYAPAIDALDLVARGFREIEDQAQTCRFANCRHLREPDCAVKTAVESGDISARRYESYRRLLALAEKLATPGAS
jgi:ribosome biogenesis GTPase